MGISSMCSLVQGDDCGGWCRGLGLDGIGVSAMLPRDEDVQDVAQLLAMPTMVTTKLERLWLRRNRSSELAAAHFLLRAFPASRVSRLSFGG